MARIRQRRGNLCRILIATSDRDWRHGVSVQLRQAGFLVVAADDGIECIRKLRMTHPSVLVLDVDLLWGGADGALDLMREDFAHGPSILVIGELPSHGRAFVPDAECLPKQIDPNAVMAAVLRLTSRQLSLSIF